MQYDSCRYISWKSLFGILKPGSGSAPAPRVPVQKPTPKDDESQKKAEQVARQWREEKARLERHLDTSDSPQSAPTVQSTPHSVVDELRAARPSATSKDTSLFPSFTEANVRRKKSKISKSDKDLYSSSLYRRNSFVSPLQTEQKDAMRKYLDMGKQEPLRPGTREKYPWEEAASVPWNGNRDRLQSIRLLLDSHSSQLPSKKIASDQRPSGPYSRTRSQKNTEKSELENSRCYTHLRDHHVRLLLSDGKSARSVTELEAEVELYKRMDTALGSVGKQMTQPEDAMFFKNFKEGMRRCYKVKRPFETVTPFVYYLLASHGFDPTAGYRIFDRPALELGQTLNPEYDILDSSVLSWITDKGTSSSIQILIHRVSIQDREVWSSQVLGHDNS